MLDIKANKQIQFFEDYLLNKNGLIKIESTFIMNKRKQILMEVQNRILNINKKNKRIYDDNAELWKIEITNIHDELIKNCCGIKYDSINKVNLDINDLNELELNLMINEILFHWIYSSWLPKLIEEESEFNHIQFSGNKAVVNNQYQLYLLLDNQNNMLITIQKIN